MMRKSLLNKLYEFFLWLSLIMISRAEESSIMDGAEIRNDVSYFAEAPMKEQWLDGFKMIIITDLGNTSEVDKEIRIQLTRKRAVKTVFLLQRCIHFVFLSDDSRIYVGDDDTYFSPNAVEIIGPIYGSGFT